MRSAFRWLTSILFLAVVVQVGLAGYGAFSAIHKADHTSVSKKTIEDGFNAHAVLGSAVVVIMLALLILAVAGRLGPAAVRFAGVLLALGVLQAILGAVSISAPVLGFLHTVNALAIFAVSGLLAHRASTPGRRSGSGGAADAALAG